MARPFLTGLLTLLVLGCDGSPVAVHADPPGDPAAPASLASLDMSSWASVPDFPSVLRYYSISGVDARHVRLLIGPPTVTSSDESVARVLDVSVQTVDIWGQPLHSAAVATVLEVGPGSAEITAKLGYLSVSETLRVLPFPSAPIDLVVDSFQVGETPGSVGFLYTPFLWLSQPSDPGGESLVAVEVALGPLSTGWLPAHCTAPIAVGQRLELHGWQDVPNYDGDLQLWSATAWYAARPASVRVLVQDESHGLGIIEASAPIHPLSLGDIPSFPASCDP